jgi:hypothetical protein
VLLLVVMLELVLLLAVTMHGCINSVCWLQSMAPRQPLPHLGASKHSSTGPPGSHCWMQPVLLAPTRAP